MPKDFTAPSQNWNVQDQFNQSKHINQEKNDTLDLYKKKTENIKFIQSSLDELENGGQDVSSLRKKLDEKLSSSELGFGEKLGVVGRNLGNDYVSSFSKAFGGNLENLYSQKLDEAKQKREEVINPISTIATEVALDPLTYTPLNFASKGTKAVRMAKDFGKGAGLSAGLYTAKEYGDDNYKATDSAIAGAFGGGLNALLGRVLNRKVAGDLTNPDATSGENITNKILFEQKKLNPDVVAAPTQPIGDEVVQENVIKPNNNSDDIASKINKANFGDTNIVQPDIQVRSDMPKVDDSTSPIEKKDYSPYIFENNSKPISKLPDTLPLNDKEEMKSIIQYAKDNDAVDEFISKLPQNARVDEVQKFFDNLTPTQIKEDGIIPVTTNKKEPIKNYDIPSLQEFEGLTKATGNNTADVLSLSIPTSTSGVRNAIERYIGGAASQRDIEILDAVENFMKNEGDNFRQKVGVSKPDTSMKIDDAIRNDIDYKTADANGAIPFSNGTQTFGGASVGGLESEFNQRDYNNDGKHDYKDNIYGVIVGALGINAAKKLFPKAFKDGNIDANTNGMFVGARPDEQGAFSDIATKKVMREIDDSKSTIPRKGFIELFLGNKSSVGNVLEHNELFAKYPEMKEIPIYTTRGETSFDGHVMLVDRKYLEPRNKDALRNVILHELQHSIQNNEGWARGGSPETFSKKLPHFEELYKQLSKERDDLTVKYLNSVDRPPEMRAEIERLTKLRDEAGKIADNPTELEKYRAYERLWGEQQARSTQQRMNMTPEQRASEDWTQTLAKNEGKYNEPIIKYDNGVAMSIDKNSTDTKDLMIQHNLSQDNLRYANNKGGILAPSLATVKKDMPIDGFGDITLIGDKSLATPSKDMKAFASDIYSPRHPREFREYSQSDIRKIDNSLINYIHKTGGGDVSTSNDVSNLIDNVALKAKFLEEQKGISLKIPNRVNPQEQTLKQFYKSEYNASISNKGLDYQALARDPKFQKKVAKELAEKYKDNEKALSVMLQPDRLINLAKDRAMNLDQIGRSQNKPDLYKAREIADKHIAKYKSEFENYVKNIQESYAYKSSFNNNGKQQPYTEQNVTKYLTSNLRGGENFNYGAGNIRAVVTPEFKTIEQIKKAKERLVTSKEFEIIKSSIDNELSDIISKITDDGIGNSFTAREIASEFISDYAKRGKRALSDYSVKVKPENFAEIDSFLNKLREMPTEYFESKFLGKMELSKFKLAIIPKNASKETKDILASHGIKYKTYDPKLPDSRIEVIKREAEKNNVLFASPTISGGLVGGVTGATSDLDGDGKITYKDIAIGALGGAGLTKGALLARNTNIANKAKSIIKNIADTETADKIFGHKIYQKTDYMNLREAMISSKNKQMESFALLHEQLKLLDDTTRTKMYNYMSGDKSIQLNANIKQLADNYTNEINRMGKELVDLGVLEKAQFDKFKDRYLHRRYEKDLSQKFNSLFTKGKTVQGVYARGNEWTGTKTEYEQLLNDGKIGDFFQGKIEATRMNNGQYKFRQDWTDEQRARWGEIKDIAFSLPETLMRTREMIDHAKMLKNIVDNTGYVSNDALEGYVQLSGKRYGALNGKYVPSDIASDIKEFGDALFGTEGKLLSSKGMEAFKALSTFWKKSHTVYNPIAHLNNLTSNVTMQFGAGINPHKAIANAYKGALASQKVNQFRELTAKKIIGLTAEENAALRALSQDEDLKLWNQAQQAGLFGRSNLNDILNKYVNPGNTQMSSSKFKNAYQKVDEVTSSWYQGEDNIMRFSMLKSLTENGTSFDEAIKMVNSTIPDYTKPMSQWARFGRDSMLTPFISWTYYATPIVLRQMKDRPERIAAIYGALYGMNQLMGIDPFNEKDIPQQNFSMKRIPIYKNGNEVTTIKVDRWIPHNDILNPLDFVKNLTSGGAWTPIADIPRNRHSYFGGKITHNEGALKAYDLSKYAVQQITPDALDNVYNLIESKVMSEKKRTKNPVIKPRTTTEELLKNVGLNIMTYNKTNQARKVANEKMK